MHLWDPAFKGRKKLLVFYFNLSNSENSWRLYFVFSTSPLFFSKWRPTEAQLMFTNLMVMWILFHLVTCDVFMWVCVCSCVYVCVCLSRLVDCLRDFGAADWQLAGQACQTMWNLLGGGSEKLLDTRDREMLVQILTTFLGVCHLSWHNKRGTRAEKTNNFCLRRRKKSFNSCCLRTPPNFFLFI